MDINDKLDNYEKSSLNTIIKTNVNSIDDLQSQWDSFMNMYKKKRKDSDDMSVMLTGETNEVRYNNQMNKLLNEEADILISPEKIKAAKEWSASSNIAIVYPDEDVDCLYNKYMLQSIDNRRKADWEALDLFGVDNVQLYGMIKNNIIANNNNNEYDNAIQCRDLSVEESSSYIDNINRLRKINNSLDNITKSFNENNSVSMGLYICPYFTPIEINQLEGYYSDSANDEYVDMFNEYTKYYYNLYNEFNPTKWYNEVTKLQYLIQYEQDVQKINQYKQEMVLLGWNPEISYNPENQHKAQKRLDEIYSNEYKNITMLDAQSLYESFNDEHSYSINESTSKDIYPISIILVKGKTLFSDITVKITNGPYSHAALCIDNDFERLYSYNMNTANKFGGFSLESIKNYPQDNKLAVYTFFVEKAQWETINNNLQNLLYNIKNTSYSFINLFTLGFKNIELNRKDKLICSQFVDTCLKLANIDITEKSSDKVTPNDLYRSVLKNAYIYKVYEGVIKGFDHKKAQNFVIKMSKQSKTINENYTILDKFIFAHENAIVTEARKFPIEYKNNGDLLLSKPDSLLNLNEEYFNSHKLLLQYEKSKNYNGMKYELCRLYYMNYILEHRTHSKNKLYKSKRDDYIKTRARVLNDFNKYFSIIQKNEPSFNFGEYYEKSEFYHNTVEIKKSTLVKFKDIFNNIL